MPNNPTLADELCSHLTAARELVKLAGKARKPGKRARLLQDANGRLQQFIDRVNSAAGTEFPADVAQALNAQAQALQQALNPAA